MRRVFMSTEECRPGMLTAENIFNDYGAVIVSENTMLDEHLIRKLRNLDINKVRIYEEEGDLLAADRSELFKAQYNDNLDVLKNILHEISSGKKIDTQKINRISESVMERISENSDIVGCITQVRSADEYTYTHCINVSFLSMLIGKWMKMDPARIKMLVQAGLLHDIGKIKVPQDILNKPGPLTPEEFDEMKKHAIYGFRMIENVPELSDEIKKAVLMHHERDNGSGYPLGLKGARISDFAKIIAVADIYDAMTSQRRYRERESPFEVFEMMENQTFGVLDTKIVKVFLNNIASYYIGDHVKLSNGETAEIIYINAMHFSQPIVHVNGEYIDLAVRTGIKIVELL